MKKYIVSWSGGKDSALSLYKAKQDGIDVVSLFTMVSGPEFTMSHHIPIPVLEKQAQAMNLPVSAVTADWNSYEARFIKMLSGFRDEGAEGCVFGDIDILDHLEWCRSVCKRVGVEARHPLWGYEQKDLFSEFIDLGFEAVIVVVQLDKLGPEWLGRKLTAHTIYDLEKAGVSVCGEFGEYHTLVTNGPIFTSPLELNKLGTLTHNGYGFLDYTLKY